MIILGVHEFQRYLRYVAIIGVHFFRTVISTEPEPSQMAVVLGYNGHDNMAHDRFSPERMKKEWVPWHEYPNLPDVIHVRASSFF
jgi:hypothetical protein